jgi:hypothetical protein
MPIDWAAAISTHLPIIFCHPLLFWKSLSFLVVTVLPSRLLVTQYTVVFLPEYPPNDIAVRHGYLSATTYFLRDLWRFLFIDCLSHDPSYRRHPRLGHDLTVEDTSLSESLRQCIVVYLKLAEQSFLLLA